MTILCILLLLLSGCVNINYYQNIVYPKPINEEIQTEQEKNETAEEKAEIVKEVIIQEVLKPVLPIEPPVNEVEDNEISFLDIVKAFKQTVSGYELNYFTPLSIYELYGVNELIVEEFVGGNRISENEIVEAVVLKAREGLAEHVYQMVVQRQAFLLAQYPESVIVNQAVIERKGNWILYGVLAENQTLIDVINNLIDQF